MLCSSRCSLKKSDGFILTVNDATVEEISALWCVLDNHLCGEDIGKDISKGQT